MRVIITGTHFTPAEAVISELKEEKDVEIIYVGRKTTREGDSSISVESKILPNLQVKFLSLTTGRLQRSFSFYTIPSLFKIPIGFIQAFIIIFTQKPDVILSFGGYVAVPLVFWGWFFSIPIIVHEQTLISGLANKISNFFADKIAVTFNQKYQFPEDKTIISGNPIRKEILEPKKLTGDFKKIFDLKLPTILITGGNQGSHIINENVGKVLSELTKSFAVIHQTGDSKFLDFEKLTEQKGLLKNPERYLVNKWISVADFGAVLKNIDLVVSRAGINTLLELAYHGVPTILIPIPYISSDEQTINAKFFQRMGFVNILAQKSLNPVNLLAEIKNSFKNLEKLKENGKKAKEVVILNAAQKIALEVLLLGSGKN